MISDTGEVPPTYVRAGRAAYEAFARTIGERDNAPWHGLVWAVQLAWCEAARAVVTLYEATE